METKTFLSLSEETTQSCDKSSGMLGNVGRVVKSLSPAGEITQLDPLSSHCPTHLHRLVIVFFTFCSCLRRNEEVKVSTSLSFKLCASCHAFIFGMSFWKKNLKMGAFTKRLNVVIRCLWLPSIRISFISITYHTLYNMVKLVIWVKAVDNQCANSRFKPVPRSRALTG